MQDELVFIPDSMPADLDWGVKAGNAAEAAQGLGPAVTRKSHLLFFDTNATDEDIRIQECVKFMKDAAVNVQTRGFPKKVGCRWP